MDPARRAAQRRGLGAEAFVADWLEARGHRIVARNWRGGGAELDLVAVRDGCVRFVEVKARSSEEDLGLEAIGRDKQRRLARAARCWLDARTAQPREACFAVALVHTASEPWQIEWIDDAFDAPGF